MLCECYQSEISVFSLLFGLPALILLLYIPCSRMPFSGCYLMDMLSDLFIGEKKKEWLNRHFETTDDIIRVMLLLFCPIFHSAFLHLTVTHLDVKIN